MPRACTVCQHPERAAIEAALVAGAAATAIGARYRVSHDAVSRHSASHLPETLALAAQAVAVVQLDQQADALDVMAELRRVFVRCNLLADACDAWLRDPTDPTRYDLGPRAEEVQVIYREAGPDGKVIRQKAPLDELLGRVAAEGRQVDGWESKRADPRDLVLRTAAQLRPSIELLAKLLGELDERPQLNLTVAPEWLAVRSALLEALGPYPEARAAVARRLVALEGGADGTGD